MRVKNLRNKKIRDNPFCRTFIFTPQRVLQLRVSSKLNNLAAFKHLPFFFTRVAKHDATKTPFSILKKIDEFLGNFGGRRQIDAESGERSDSFASMSAAVSELSRISGRGGAESAP